MRTQRENPWFQVKRHGYGVGLPITWQGWALCFMLVLAAALMGLWLHGLAYVIAIMLLGGVFAFVAHQKSDAEWRWRNDD